jgi:hypothetical protein
MRHEDAPGRRQEQSQAGRVPYKAVRRWYLKFEQGQEFPEYVAAEDGHVPVTVPISRYKPAYWPLSATGGRDGSLISSALRAEAAWIALNERPLWQWLREKSL